MKTSQDFSSSKSKIFRTLLFLSFCGFFLFSMAQEQESELIQTPHLDIYLNNNPSFKGGVIHGNQVVNTPWIMVEGERLPADGTLQISVYNTKNDVLFKGKKEIKIKDGDFVEDFVLDSPLDDPQYAHIMFNTETEKFDNILPIKLHKIYGNITWFNGSPIDAHFIVSGGEISKNISATADANGNYTLWLPEKKVHHIFIDNETYSKTSLECFIGHEFTLKRDLNIDLHIDRMELYNMRSWASYTAFYIYFIPMSLPRLRDTTKVGKREEWPKLSVDKVSVYINEQKIPIIFFNEIVDYLRTTGEDNKVVSRPSYIVSIDIKKVRNAYKKEGRAIIRVVAEDEIVYPDRVDVIKGEAILINPPIA